MSVDRQHVNQCQSEAHPPDWREVPLSSVAEIRFSSVDKKAEPGERPVRLCNYTDVYNNDYVRADMDFMRATATLVEIDRFGLRAGDVIITKDSETPNDIGVPTVVDLTSPDLVCGYHLALIRPRNGEVDSTFLANQLRGARITNYFGRQANGTTRYGLSTASIAQASLRLPDIAQQRAVGKIIRLIDATIAKTEAVIAKLKHVRTGLLRDLLTRGLNDNGELRDPLKHPEQFQDSPLGRMPKAWTCKPLLDETNWFSGGTPDRSQAAWWKGSIPFLSAKDMKSFEISDASEHVTEIAAQSGSRLMPSNTVFIVVRGMILAHTFPVCLSTTSFAFNQDVKAVRGKTSLSTRFLAHWFVGNSNVFLRKATEATHGTKKLDMSELNRALIALPPTAEQELIVQRIEISDRLIGKSQSELETLRQLKSGLMSDLLTGRVRVPDNIATESTA